MKTLGYIVTEKKLSGIYGFVKQVTDISDADLTKPTLIVGWELAKQFDGYDILDRKLGENLFWTFSRTENRSILESDINKFYEFIKKKTVSSCDYKFVSVFRLRFEKLKKLVCILNSSGKRNIYISSGMVYVKYGDTVVGVSLTELEYCKIKPDKVLGRIENNANLKVFSNNDWKIKKLERFLGNKKYAVLCFIDDE